MLHHLRYAVTAGLAVGLAAAAVDAAVLGWRGLWWMAFAFLAYGLAAAAVTAALALVARPCCGMARYRPGPRTLAAFYLGLPSLALAAFAASEVLRRFLIPALFRSRHEVAPILAASLCGFIAGAVFLGVLIWAARCDARESRGEAGGQTGQRQGSRPEGGRQGAKPEGARQRAGPEGSQRAGAASRRLRWAGVAVAGLAALSALALLVGSAAYRLGGSQGRNLVIVCVDALRPDHLSCYGYGRPTSPNVDKVCGEGVRFDRAICQSPGSTASHASIMTSLYPLTHGAWNIGDSLHEGVPSLQKHLRDRGYATAFFGNNYFLGPRFGFSSGYESFGNEELAYRTKGAPFGFCLRSLGAARLLRAWRVQPGAPSTFSIDQSIAWIKKNRKRKFFLFLHIMDPHAPYSPPGDYRRKFFSRQYKRELRDGPKLRDRIDSLEPWEKKQLVDLYDGDVAYADSKVGALVAALERWGIYDKTVLVITADHAEVLEEHGGIFNHGYLWDCCIRVPLIMRYPPAIPAGIVRRQVVQSIDMAPTALALLGEPPLADAQGADLSGLFEADLGADAGAEDGVAYTLGGITKGEGYAVTERRWKLAWIDDEHIELYDLERDPGETMNLIDERTEVADRLKRKLLIWIKKSEAAAIVPKSETVDLQRLDDEVKERLRTLGYIK